ncbi:unnamed protein product [Rotaria socialis]|uniref:Cyclic nucleotide-binding domain-containing protein n=1 Tax=Rotaria socialis TaxID=392032 RepID=A0A821S106_9BILA|nr:unnamed protein product [Rotaria socialis]
MPADNRQRIEYVPAISLRSQLCQSFVLVLSLNRLVMLQRGITSVTLRQRRTPQNLYYPSTAKPVLMQRSPSFSRDYFYRKMRKFIRLIRLAVRVCLVVRKYANEGLYRADEQIVFENKDILFDLRHFRRPAEDTIGRHIRKILKSDPKARSQDDIRMVVSTLSQVIRPFTEFPLQQQYSIARVGRLEEFEMGRVILREGHRAEKFYLIIDGITDVYKLLENPVTKMSSSRLVAVLKKGSAFGEIALLHGKRRTATVTCQTDVTMLAIEQEDFVRIFMSNKDEKEPDFITYLRQIPQFRGFPMEKIPHNDSYFCHVVYYHMGTVICKDSNKDDWIYVIRAGCCRAIKALTQVTPNLTLKKKTEIIYDRFSTKIISPYSMEALGAYRYRAATAKPCACFTEVEQLCEKSVFGLFNVLADEVEKIPSLTLVSDGVECILIRRSFFIKWAPGSQLDRLRREARSYDY